MFLFHKSCRVNVFYEGDAADAEVRLVEKNGDIEVFLTAEKSMPTFVELCWSHTPDEGERVLGDAWERSYGDLQWLPVGEENRPMPWYFFVTDGKNTTGCGVKTQPNSFVCFYYTKSGVRAVFDCRNGGSGVLLQGRELSIGTLVSRLYEDVPAFAAAKRFCRVLCTQCLLPREIVYGGNNWYYAYGKSSAADILADTAIQVRLSHGIDNPPFMVIDDGWQENNCVGPWLPNEKFGDMQELAKKMKALGARPGIWVRFLNNQDPSITEDMHLVRGNEREYLDPTVPAVQALIRADIRRLQSWGYELIKHDYSTFDLFGDFGKDLRDTITNDTGWHFHDRTKTNAEITLDFYRLIKETCGDTLVIGCNTVSHLAAGLVELNRIGDDTSGEQWERTKKMGINTLAFRLCQHGAFYAVDADCVGILEERIDWRLNRQWLDLLAKSGTPLFVSCNDAISEEKQADLHAAYLTAQHTDLIAEPLDWLATRTPSVWNLNGEKTEYTW